MALWVVKNPDVNAVGCPHPRPNPAEGRTDLQLDGYGFQMFTGPEIEVWKLSPGFMRLWDSGRIVVEETDEMPKPRPELPAGLRPENDFDRAVAWQIAMAPDSRESNEIQFQRINMFRETDESTGRDWIEPPDLDASYLRTRHRQLLAAAKWYLERYVEKRNPVQNQRLKEINRQLKAIDAMV